MHKGAFGDQPPRIDPTGRDAPSTFCGPVLPDETADTPLTGRLRYEVANLKGENPEVPAIAVLIC